MSLERRTLPHGGLPAFLPYLFAPAARKGHAAAPLLLFLHGGRDRGDDLGLLLRWAPPRLVDEAGELPYHFAAPQIAADTTWPEHTDALLALIDHLVSHEAVDPDRVILAGFSLGAAGAWEIASKAPQRFAGLITVSGRANERVDFEALKSLPTWVFHGGRDDKLPATDTERTVAQLRVRGAAVNYSFYPHGDHFIADQAFADPGLQPWLLSRHRGAVRRAA